MAYSSTVEAISGKAELSEIVYEMVFVTSRICLLLCNDVICLF